MSNCYVPCFYRIDFVVIPSHIVLPWLKSNSTKTYPGKFQFMVLKVKNIAPFRLKVNGKMIPSSNEVKLLVISSDNKLKETHREKAP